MGNICDKDDEDKRVVEETDWYKVYQALFITAYLVLSILNYYVLSKQLYQMKQKHRKINLDKSAHQIMLALGTGALVRAVSFIDSHCAVEELWRWLKDVFWMMAFCLIILYWVELQASMRAISGLKKLRPVFLAMVVSYSILRFMTGISELFLGSTAENLFNGLSAIVYFTLLIIAVVYGSKLMSKMSAMVKKSQGPKEKILAAKFRKLGIFLGIEVIVVILATATWGTRQFFFSDAKENDPWLWWYLKVIEKFFEWIMMMVLCLTMTGSNTASKEPEKRKGSTRSSLAGVRRESSSRSTRSSTAGGDRGRAMSKQGAAVELTTLKESPTGIVDASVVNPLQARKASLRSERVKRASMSGDKP